LQRVEFFSVLIAAIIEISEVNKMVARVQGFL
jgi:hypothetical protein